MGASAHAPSMALLLLLISLLLFTSSSHGLPASNPLTPPLGNSLSMTYKTFKGIHFYRCVGGGWVPKSIYAILVDASGVVAGNYSLVPNPKLPQYAGTWTLFNNAGDGVEGGSSYSSVSGEKRYIKPPGAPENMQDFLSVASSHEDGGTTARVSYIAQVGSRGGVPSFIKGHCKSEGQLIKEAYEATYEFWTQDMLPPSSMPATLAVAGNPIYGIYATGVVTYVYNGNSWVNSSNVAAMYDVPGGSPQGSYFTTSRADQRGGSFCWSVSGPNGFQVVAKPACKDVQVTPDGLPWSLNSVTSTSVNSSIFGPYTYIQVVSTRGGLPPKANEAPPKKGAIWKSPFSAIYWFYSN